MTASTGVKSYSTTAANNVQANTGINWDEGMSPAAVNNSARANMKDMRDQWNDSPWFGYNTGDMYTAGVYVSATSFKYAAIDVSTVYHKGRRVRAVGSGTGTIYGTITAVAFSTDTTVTVVWDSGSLSNETLTISIGPPFTGHPVIAPVAFAAFLNSATQAIANNTATKVTLSSEEYDVGGFFDSATNYRFLPLVSGYYHFDARVQFASANAGVVEIDLYKNGSEYKRGPSVPFPSGGSGLAVSMSALVYMNGSTDYVELYVQQTSGGSLNLTGGTNNATNYLHGFYAAAG